MKTISLSRDTKGGDSTSGLVEKKKRKNKKTKATAAYRKARDVYT